MNLLEKLVNEVAPYILSPFLTHIINKALEGTFPESTLLPIYLLTLKMLVFRLKRMTPIFKKYVTCNQAIRQRCDSFYII